MQSVLSARLVDEAIRCPLNRRDRRASALSSSGCSSACRGRNTAQELQEQAVYAAVVATVLECTRWHDELHPAIRIPAIILFNFYLQRCMWSILILNCCGSAVVRLWCRVRLDAQLEAAHQPAARRVTWGVWCSQRRSVTSRSSS